MSSGCVRSGAHCRKKKNRVSGSATKVSTTALPPYGPAGLHARGRSSAPPPAVSDRCGGPEMLKVGRGLLREGICETGVPRLHGFCTRGQIPRGGGDAAPSPKGPPPRPGASAENYDGEGNLGRRVLSSPGGPGPTRRVARAVFEWVARKRVAFYGPDQAYWAGCWRPHGWRELGHKLNADGTRQGRVNRSDGPRRSRRCRAPCRRRVRRYDQIVKAGNPH